MTKPRLPKASVKRSWWKNRSGVARGKFFKRDHVVATNQQRDHTRLRRETGSEIAARQREVVEEEIRAAQAIERRALRDAA